MKIFEITRSTLMCQFSLKSRISICSGTSVIWQHNYAQLQKHWTIVKAINVVQPMLVMSGSTYFLIQFSNHIPSLQKNTSSRVSFITIQWHTSTCFIPHIEVHHFLPHVGGRSSNPMDCQVTLLHYLSSCSHAQLHIHPKVHNLLGNSTALKLKLVFCYRLLRKWLNQNINYVDVMSNFFPLSS